MRGEVASSNNYSEMSESAGKRRKMYVDYPKDRYKHTCIIYIPHNSSYECKVLGYFGSDYSKIRPTKDRGHNPEKKYLTYSKKTRLLLIMKWMKFYAGK